MKNAFAYYLLKRAQYHCLHSCPEAYIVLVNAACDVAEKLTAEEQFLVLAINARISFGDELPDWFKTEPDSIWSTAGLDPVFAEVPRG